MFFIFIHSLIISYGTFRVKSPLCLCSFPFFFFLAVFHTLVNLLQIYKHEIYHLPYHCYSQIPICTCAKNHRICGSRAQPHAQHLSLLKAKLINDNSSTATQARCGDQRVITFWICVWAWLVSDQIHSVPEVYLLVQTFSGKLSKLWLAAASFG